MCGSPIANSREGYTGLRWWLVHPQISLQAFQFLVKDSISHFQIKLGKFLTESSTCVCVCVCVCMCVRARMCTCVRLVTQLWPTLCNSTDYSPPGSSVHGISQQEYWSGLLFPSGDLPDPGIKPVSPAWQADSLPLSHQGSPTYYHAHTCWLGGYFPNFYTLYSSLRPHLRQIVQNPLAVD